ncbi:type 1 glutamine amidotransferase [Microbulbifer sp. VAAC004]|uniref:type 1 glutamine amidotransferase n=1 Tax=unclassified Microbulbifer TaxID=2619833 RepID=UPI00403A3634
MQEPILIIQHEEHEGPGYIADWASQRQIPTILINPQISILPDTGFSGVIILGGMMNVEDQISLPWLADEIHWVKSIVNRQVPIVGICLGAQILAHALGADIKPMKQEELGWYPVHWTTPETLTLNKVFQAHSYFFDIPKNAKHLASSALCPNQAFLYGENILGLQFHLEWSQQQVARLFPEYFQKHGSSVNNHTASRKALFQLLNQHFSKEPPKK